MGSRDGGLGAGHVRQEHSMHAFTSISLPFALPWTILRRLAIRFAIVGLHECSY